MAIIALAAFSVLAMAAPWIQWLTRRVLGQEDDGLPRMQNTPSMGGVLVTRAILTSTVLLTDLRVFHVRMILLCLILYGGLGTVHDWLSMKRRGWGRPNGLRPWVLLGCEAAAPWSLP